MNPAKQLSSELKRNLYVIVAQTDGLSHEESLIQPPFNANCMNWILGHMVVGRTTWHRLTATTAPFDATAYARFERDSPPITGPGDGLPLAQMLADLAASNDVLLARLAEMSDADFAALVEGSDRSVESRLGFHSWHETYHVGQTELLRQVAGKNDKII